MTTTPRTVRALAGAVAALALAAGLLTGAANGRADAAPALVLEKLGPFVALKRGWLLSRGAFWRLLGLYILTNIIVQVVTGVLSVPLSFGLAVVMFSTTSILALSIAQGVLYALVYTITISFLASVVALLYIDVRMRREGLDVELTAAAARLQDG